MTLLVLESASGIFVRLRMSVESEVSCELDLPVEPEVSVGTGKPV